MQLISGTAGKLGGIGTVHPDHPDVPVARAVAGIGDLVGKGREAGLNFAGGVAGQPGDGSAMGAFQIDIGIGCVAQRTDNDPLAVGRDVGIEIAAFFTETVLIERSEGFGVEGHRLPSLEVAIKVIYDGVYLRLIRGERKPRSRGRTAIHNQQEK